LLQCNVSGSGFFQLKNKNMPYTEQDKENDRVVRLCYDHLDKFTDIYPKDKNADGLRWENKMPENVKLTVYCKGSEDEGFLVNMTSDELGLEALISQKWIIHSELEKLAGYVIA
jgi:hypothetical protein